MLFINKLLSVGLLSAGISAATAAQAGFQLFDGAWTIRAFGNACAVGDPTPGPHCTGTETESDFYEGFGMPQALQCQPHNPRCPFASTPTDGNFSFNPLGGSKSQALYCDPWANWRGKGTTARPPKGGTYKTAKNNRPVPPLFRDYQFFTATTSNALPYTYSCVGTSTNGFGGPGPVQLGNPITGRWYAITTGNQKGGFSFSAAAASVPTVLTQGVRATAVAGEFGPFYPYVYSYTYATLRNDQGVFGPGVGPGDFNITFMAGDASINVKQGAARFGGTMRMLGAMTAKACYYRDGGCSLGTIDWRYDAVGASAYYDNTTGSGSPTPNAVITHGYEAFATAMYYHTALMETSTIMVEGSRFPWTTGSVTVTAVGRGPHRTVHYAKGFDNRNTATPNGMGTIQMVTPVLTRWLQPCCNWETGGIGIFRLKFVPEPQMWAVLVAGLSLLGVGARLRRR